MGSEQRSQYTKLRNRHDADVSVDSEDDEDVPRQYMPSSDGRKKRLVVFSLLVVFLALLSVFWSRPRWAHAPGCRDTIDDGYQCVPDISRHWGQYSPYFSVPSDELANEVPPGCEVTFVNILSRHGARDPTSHKTALYNDTISRIQRQSAAGSFRGKYAFLKSYKYTLGAGELNDFGAQQLVNSGIKFFRRYEALAAKHTPFVRTASMPRVADSAKHWSRGFHETKALSHQDDDFPYETVVIWEGDAFNNTLDHSRCDEFEHGSYSQIGGQKQHEFMSVFLPPILERLKKDLPGVNLTDRDAVNLMQICPFDTVADPVGTPSPFCALFSPAEFRQLSWYETLDKYYGNGAGNPLGSTQGVGYVNELLARMTGRPVEDETSTNSTLDDSADTFPLDRKLYADFSHDNDLAGIFFALGLYNNTPTLPTTYIMDEDRTAGFSASWSVPFASRAYFEKMKCDGAKGKEQELVRIIVNDRVMPLEGCDADKLGRCTLSKFVESQSFARTGGRWDMCFT